MRFWKWEVWPWNWRKVRKAQITKEDREIFERYGEAVVASILASNPSTTEIHAYIAGQDYEPSSQGRRPAARDWLTECRDAHERREQRLESIEIGVVALITLEIILSLTFGGIGIYDARKQGKVLDHMDASAAATAETMQAVRDELKSLASDQAKAREILEQQERDRLAQLAKKPELVLLVGHVLLTRGHGAVKPTQQSDNSATFNFVLQNMGEATTSKVYFRAITPRDISVASSSPEVPITDFPDRPDRVSVWYYPEPITPKEYIGIRMTFYFPPGHSPFQVTFNADSLEIASNTPLGVLTVTPQAPSNTSSPSKP
jgi:hypothetical protein